MRTGLLALAVLFIVVAVPMAAVATSGADDVGGAVALSPSDGPNGEYATVEDDEIRIDFARLNKEARTTFDSVFEITATASEPVRVWVEVEAEDGVTAYRGDDPDATFDEDNPARLQPGDTLDVGFRVDTRGQNPDSGTVKVVVLVPENESDTPTASPTQTPAQQPTPTPTPTATQTPTSTQTTTPTDDGTETTTPARTPTDDGNQTNTTTPPPTPTDNGTGTATPIRTPTPTDDGEDWSVEVDIDGLTDSNATVRERDSLPPDGEPGIRATSDPTGDILGGEDGLQATGDRFVTQEGEDITLTGVRSTVGSATQIAGDRKPAAIFDVDPGDEQRDNPGTVRIRLSRDRFDETEPTKARVGRHTTDGWQLLPTRVVSTTEETVTLEAQTDGFGVFTVFPESRVDYEWTLSDGRTVSAEELRASFDEPGPHDVVLTVTDSQGRSDRARQRILVNDEPTVTIERADTAGGDGTTLRANVTNEIGNATVTWTLPDGSTTTGASVTGTFTSGQAVRVTVTDEYGATGTDEVTIGSAGGASPRNLLTELRGLPSEIPFPVQVGLALLSVTSVAVVVRSPVPWRVGAGARQWVARVADEGLSGGPRIDTVENVWWDADGRVFVIEDLIVESDGGLLDSVEITVTDGAGATIVQKTIDAGGRDAYTAGPERIHVYGDVELTETGNYTVEVRATDERDRVRTHQESRDWSPFAGTDRA